MHASRERLALVRLVFVDSLPVMIGNVTWGFVAGVLLAAKGGISLAPLWALMIAAFWATGTVSFAAVPLVAAREPILSLVVMALMVNFRYVLYSFTMLSRWKDMPFWNKCYLILVLADDSYALEVASPIRDPQRYRRYCTYLSAFIHCYWVAGMVTGASVVALLGMAIDPERIRAYTNGMEFVMAALFISILTDQVIAFIKKGGK